jgi:hypothetical protein
MPDTAEPSASGYESTFSTYFNVRENQIIWYWFLEDRYGLVKALTK